MNDNVSAISTAIGPAGVAVIRISGKSPLSVAEKMFKPLSKVAVKDFVPNFIYVGEIDCDSFTDFGMCVYFKAPKSFTGEDVVEFHCHGGIAITRGVLDKTLRSGARLATKGEFTKRAFINGKLSLASAEGLIDMINSETEASVRAGFYLYREKLTKEVERLQALLLDALAELNADMDFPEEDVAEFSYNSTKVALNSVLEGVKKLLQTFKAGRVVKNGVKVGIIGKPNTGKSSLLNALLNDEKAIVSDIAGTTRDIVEGSLDINGIRFNFSDTAGIRESTDKIEEIGVKLSRRILDSSDVLVFVADGQNFNKEDEEIYASIKDKKVIFVQNKMDLAGVKLETANVLVSALRREGIEKLKSQLYQVAIDGVDLNGDFICEERHREALSVALEKVLTALREMGGKPSELIAIDVKGAWDALGEITGVTANEEIINNIFSKFCVGK